MKIDFLAIKVQKYSLIKEIFLEIKFVIVYLNLIFFNYSSLICQTSILTKQGGICFRVDDNQAIQNWTDYSNIFNKHGFKFCAALNFTNIVNNTSYIQLVKNLQLAGHEILDHTPDHTVAYFNNVSDTSYYSGREGVDHITEEKRVCLKIAKIDTNTYINEGLVNIQNNMVFSVKNGEFFKDIGSTVYVLYFPTINKLCNIIKAYNRDSTDIDTLLVKTIWNENVDLGILTNIPYHKIGIFDITLDKKAIELLIERSVNLAKNIDILPPKGWIQPGVYLGNSFYLKPREIKLAAEIKYGYICAGIDGFYSYKTFNEFDPSIKRYSIGWGDFFEDQKTFNEIKKIIASRVARHYFSVGHSHFSGLLGGWTGYLARMDSLLNWCKQKKIPVMNYSEMAKKLYFDKPNPYENVFPKLDIDLDEDGFPDGYDINTAFGIFDTTDGVSSSSKKCFLRNSSGTITSVSRLGGIEKGENDFIIYTKGANGDSIRVKFQFDGNPAISKTFIFPADTDTWQKYSLSLINENFIVPDSINTLTIIIATHKYTAGTTIKISGMELRKKSAYPILPSFLLQPKIVNNKIELNWINNEREKDYQVILQRKDRKTSEYIDIVSGDKNLTHYLDTTDLEDGEIYTYRIKCITDSNEISYSDTVQINFVYSQINENNDIPSSFKLYQNYPNPFNNETIINYQVPFAVQVELKLYDILGREIKDLENSYKTAGNYSIKLNSGNLASGVYFYSLKAGNFYEARKMLLLK